ncbi:uncharacterized protein DMAD_01921 [Drosophila madeirensis]|uniref:Uncharacterized protein n=1 Tax=Drosophila madeirensis TaxID=30013 RepID=A0AAU9G3D6_DROMD
MLALHTVLMGLSVLSILTQNVNGGCSMAINDPAPLILTSFGSKHLLSAAPGQLLRENYESVQMYCAGGFNGVHNRRGYYDPKEFNSEETTKTFTCRSDDFVEDIENVPQMRVQSVRCRGTMVSQMFESIKSLPDCGDHMTLVVGQDFGAIGSIKSAGICYDIVGSELKYVSYTACPSKNRIIEKMQPGELNGLGLDINVAYTKSLFKAVSPTAIGAYLEHDKQLKQLLGGVTFEHTSLVQDEAIRSQLAGYEDMLSVVWLRTLRTGNWRNWQYALHAASEPAGSKFDIRLGVSGQVALPQMGGCNASRVLSIDLVNGSTLSVPAHIWVHVRDLHPTGKPQDEFVVIGHNSPFFKGEQMSDFCPTMCDQVVWMKNSLFGSLLDYPAYGLVQCCRVQDVAQKLDNFPEGPFGGVVASSTAIPPPEESGSVASA